MKNAILAVFCNLGRVDIASMGADFIFSFGDREFWAGTCCGNEKKLFFREILLPKFGRKMRKNNVFSLLMKTLGNLGRS